MTDSTDRTEKGRRTTGKARRAGVFLLGLGQFAGWAYVCTVFLYQEVVAGLWIGIPVLGVLLVAGFVLAIVLSGAIGRRAGRELSTNIGFALLVSVVVLVVADSGYSIYANTLSGRARSPISDDLRLADSHVWQGELMPRSFHPGSRNFLTYKPDVTLTASTFGEFYSPGMLRSRALVDSLLELRHVTYAIGPHGFRERESLADARIFALGDSFVFGYATDEGAVWTDRLGESLGEPVYNMGVSGTGPRAQLMLLEYLLESQPDSVRIDRLIWMIFEGNDLEDDYQELYHETAARAAASPLDGTVVQALGSVPGRLKNQSIVRRAIDGELVFTAREAVPGMNRHRDFDGIQLAAPLYRSDRWGYRLFAPPDVHQVTTSREYLMSHPNRPLLDETFEAMRSLASDHGFNVLVVVAPSAARMYGADFEDFPEPEEPHFARYVLDLAGRNGMDTLDLLEALRPFTKTELLYYRDDHHWNERGNAIAAQLIEAALAPHVTTGS